MDVNWCFGLVLLVFGFLLFPGTLGTFDDCGWFPIYRATDPKSQATSSFLSLIHRESLGPCAHLQKPSDRSSKNQPKNGAVLWSVHSGLKSVQKPVVSSANQQTSTAFVGWFESTLQVLVPRKMNSYNLFHNKIRLYSLFWDFCENGPDFPGLCAVQHFTC